MTPRSHTNHEGWCDACFGPASLCQVLPYDSLEVGDQVAIEA